MHTHQKLMDTLNAYANKIRNRLTGVVKVPHRGNTHNGTVLLSYMTAPFTLAPNEFFSDPHTNYWECAEIARLFAERGYDVDCINAYDSNFVPRKKYRVFIDVNTNLERLAPLLPADCVKIFHITFSYGAFQTKAEERRLKGLLERRGISLQPQRTEPTTQSPAYADFLEGFGNAHVHETYASFGKHIFPIPISVTKEYPFQESKDWITARTNFLWFGGGGAVLKGLDLVIETFATMPEYTLHIVGPAAFESEFANEYATELALPNIIRHHRPRINAAGEMHVDDQPFIKLMNRCGALIYPSASEGTSGAVIQAMHASVIPLVTKEAGIADDAPISILPTGSTADIQTAAHEIATSSPEVLKERARLAWDFAREHHTRQAFTQAYSTFIDSMLKL